VSRSSIVPQISNQFMGYCWMLDVRNIMVDQIGFQTSLKPQEKFKRPIMSYPLPVLDAWVVNTVWWIKRMIEMEQGGFYPQTFTSCMDFGKPCIFTPLCTQAPEARAIKMIQLYGTREETWDVGAAL
jgi:hypothetical protein